MSDHADKRSKTLAYPVERTFVGFGFGAIQGGLFLPEAFHSGNFSKLVVSEIDKNAVEAIRAAGGSYTANVATTTGVTQVHVDGIEILNPLVSEDRTRLLAHMAAATDMCTALPSFKLYKAGGKASVAGLLAEALGAKMADSALPPCVIFAAENDTTAAKQLQAAVLSHRPEGFDGRVQFSETVIAKMCSVVLDEKRIEAEKLERIVPNFPRAYLVEAHDRILIDKVALPDNHRTGLDNFIQKPNLEPFAVLKFLGHNANHALLGYLCREAGLEFMHQAGERPELMATVRKAFIEESGAGLRKHYADVDDPVFTATGFEAFVDDALERMVNPHLRDPVDRVIRDPERKLGWDDRLLGSMRLAVAAGVRPSGLARGAQLALRTLCTEQAAKSSFEGTDKTNPSAVLEGIWGDKAPADEKKLMSELILGS